MHVFAVLFFFALAVMGIVMVGERFLRKFPDVTAALAILVGIGLAYAAGFDMWGAWGVHIRTLWLGEALTGVALGGSAMALRSMVGFFTGLFRKFNDQADAMERQELRRVA